MFTIAKRFAIACFAVIALGQPAWAQWSFGQRPIYGQMATPINRNPMVAPGVSLQQYAYNVRVLGQAYRGIPPYLLGYNPYPAYVNYGPVYRTPFYGPYASAYTPGYYGTGYYGYPAYPVSGYYGSGPYYGGNAYTGGYTTGGIDPLTGLAIGR